MTTNRQLMLAAHTLATLAHCGDRSVTSAELADGFGTSPVVIRRVLGQLHRAGLTTSRRGAGGGTVLARPAAEISLGDAYRAVTGDDEPLLGRHPVGDGGGSPVEPLIADFLNEVYAGAEQALLDHLAAVTVADLVLAVEQRAKTLGIEPGRDG